jgi:hypothetical protein
VHFEAAEAALRGAESSWKRFRRYELAPSSRSDFAAIDEPVYLAVVTLKAHGNYSKLGHSLRESFYLFFGTTYASFDGLFVLSNSHKILSQPTNSGFKFYQMGVQTGKTPIYSSFLAPYFVVKAYESLIRARNVLVESGRTHAAKYK